jgi:hypothetical protein
MPCRICTANDEDALIDEIAAEIWASSCDPEIDDRDWEQAGPNWHAAMRRHARVVLAVARGELGAR